MKNFIGLNSKVVDICGLERKSEEKQNERRKFVRSNKKSLKLIIFLQT
jgi:hypothetical protein